MSAFFCSAKNCFQSGSERSLASVAFTFLRRSLSFARLIAESSAGLFGLEVGGFAPCFVVGDFAGEGDTSPSCVSFLDASLSFFVSTVACGTGDTFTGAFFFCPFAGLVEAFFVGAFPDEELAFFFAAPSTGAPLTTVAFFVPVDLILAADSTEGAAFPFTLEEADLVLRTKPAPFLDVILGFTFFLPELASLWQPSSE